MVFSDVPVQLAVEDSFVETVKCLNLAPLDYRAPLEFQVCTTYALSLVVPGICLRVIVTSAALCL